MSQNSKAKHLDNPPFLVPASDHSFQRKVVLGSISISSRTICDRASYRQEPFFSASAGLDDPRDLQALLLLLVLLVLFLLQCIMNLLKET